MTQETQSRLHEALKTDILLVHGMVEQASSMALDLQSTVDETSEKIKQMSLVSGIGVVMGSWGWVVMVVVGLGMVSKAAAGYAAIIAGQWLHAWI